VASKLVKALEGLRVIDFTQAMAAPFGTMNLADMGADVIKIEPPVTGEPTRELSSVTQNGHSATFMTMNRSKRGLTVDLKTPEGILVIKRPWPSMIRTIWGDPDRYKKSYYPEDFHGKYYLAGDGASRDMDGHYRIMGRIDDVLNVSGHRLGTMEIESALVANVKLVAEAAVVGRPDEMTGEAVCAFVVLKGPRPSGDEAKRIAQELRDWVGKEIGAIAKPKDIRFGDNLPKTRSGKIMRRVLAAISNTMDTGDITTLANPDIVEQIRVLVQGRHVGPLKEGPADIKMFGEDT